MHTEAEVIVKAEVLLEALPYIQRFRGSIFVVKYGGAFMDDPNPVYRDRVATDIVFLASVGIQVVVVHGGGKAISRAMAESGIDAKFQDGLRITDEATMGIVEHTLNQVINPGICDTLDSRGGKVLPLIGNRVFVCRKLHLPTVGKESPVDLGFVGEIFQVKSELIRNALDDGYIPLISCVAADDQGHPFNTNADMAAAHVASALMARRLVYLCDVPGLLEDPTDTDSLLSSLHIDQVDSLQRSGTIGSGMLPKVNSAVAALEKGVHRVHFIDGRIPHSLLLEIFTDRGIGTEIVHR